MSTLTNKAPAGMRYSPLAGKYVKDTTPKVESTEPLTTAEWIASVKRGANEPKNPNEGVPTSTVVKELSKIAFMFVVSIAGIATLFIDKGPTDAQKANIAASEVRRANEVAMLRSQGYNFKLGTDSEQACRTAINTKIELNALNKNGIFNTEVDELRNVIKANDCK